VTKVFWIEWVFVPFGCFLLRSQALLHSGHYGGPGITRYHHATFSVKGAVVEAQNLGHFHMLEELGGFEGWKLQWNPNIPRAARAADGYLQLTNTILRAWKSLGTKYYKKHIRYQVKNPVSTKVMLNLNIYKLLPPLPRKGLPKDNRNLMMWIMMWWRSKKVWRTQIGSPLYLEYREDNQMMIPRLSTRARQLSEWGGEVMITT
jgi:hypothetical protein